MDRTDSYEQAVARAATDQGLDPVMAHLIAAGLPAELQQTGGFCMTVGVFTPGVEGDTAYDHPYLFVTDAGEWNGGDGYLVVEYRNYEADGIVHSENGSLDDVVVTVRAFLDRAAASAS